MAPHLWRQRPTQNLFTKCSICSTSIGPYTIGQICVNAGSLIPTQNFCEGGSSLDWHRLLRLLDWFLVPTHAGFMCQREIRIYWLNTPIRNSSHHEANLISQFPRGNTNTYGQGRPCYCDSNSKRKTVRIQIQSWNAVRFLSLYSFVLMACPETLKSRKKWLYKIG
jgi:hypothetical protein